MDETVIRSIKERNTGHSSEKTKKALIILLYQESSVILSSRATVFMNTLLLSIILPSHLLCFILIINMEKLMNTNIMITRYTISNISQFHSTWVLVWTSDSQTCNHDPQIMRHQCSSLLRHHLVLSPSLPAFVLLNYPCP